MKPVRAGGSGGEDERLHESYLKRLSTAGGKERLSWRGLERVSSCPSPGRESRERFNTPRAVVPPIADIFVRLGV